jgi:hypothetical protein
MVFGSTVDRVRSRCSTFSAASQAGRQGIRRGHWKASFPCPPASNRRTPSLSPNQYLPRLVGPVLGIVDDTQRRLGWLAPPPSRRPEGAHAGPRGSGATGPADRHGTSTSESRNSRPFPTGTPNQTAAPQARHAALCHSGTPALRHSVTLSLRHSATLSLCTHRARCVAVADSGLPRHQQRPRIRQQHPKPGTPVSRTPALGHSVTL